MCILYQIYLKTFSWIVYLVKFQLFSEGKLYSSTLLIFPNIAFHIEVTPLANGTYKIIQLPDGDFSKAQVNTIEITEVPNFDSEEPQHTDSIDISIGKPQCIILLFQNMQLIVIIYLCIYVIGDA